MAEWKIEKTIKDTSGKGLVELRGNAPGNLYCYHVKVWMAAGEEDEGALGDGYWMRQSISGYFGTLSECETDALNSVTWLQQKESGPS